MSTICVTGHRPSKIYGYDMTDAKWTILKEKFKELLQRYDCHEAISGMALGSDMVFAMAAIELKKSGYPIKLHCAIPCNNHMKKWNWESKMLYKSIIAQADKVVVVNDAPYTPQLMQRRNEYMVDHSDRVIAVWNGSPGGTANCVAYAKKMNKPVHQIIP